MRDEKKRVLCYGDSNTWGYRPDRPFQRYPEDVRWTGVLQDRLGTSVLVIEEGLNGRTTIWDDVFAAGKNGRAYLIPCLESHRPLDLVLVMLGTNDLKMQFRLSPVEVAQGLKALHQVIITSCAGRDNAPPAVILVAPPSVHPIGVLAALYEGAEAKSEMLSLRISQMATLCNCGFFNAGEVIASSDIDGVHWTGEAHGIFADSLSKLVFHVLNMA